MGLKSVNPSPPRGVGLKSHPIPIPPSLRGEKNLHGAKRGGAGQVGVDTRFCTHDLIKKNDWNDHPCTSKIMITLHALIHSLHIIKMILRF